MFWKKDKTRMSLKIEKEIYGYKIRKLPLLKFVEAIEGIEDFPYLLWSECFPDKKISEIFDLFINLNAEDFYELSQKFLASAPKFSINFLAKLMELDAEEVFEDENLGIDGFLELLSSFLEINKLGKSLELVAKIKNQVKEIFPAGSKS